MSVFLGRLRKAVARFRDKADSTNGPTETQAHQRPAHTPEYYVESTAASLALYYVVEPWGQSLPPIPTKPLPPIPTESPPPTRTASHPPTRTASPPLMGTESPPPITTESPITTSTESLSQIWETLLLGGNSNDCQDLLSTFDKQRQQYNRKFDRAQQQVSTSCDSRRVVLENKLGSWLLHADHFRANMPTEWDTLLFDFHDVFDEMADAVLKQRVADWTRGMSVRVDRFRTDSMQALSQAKQARDRTLSRGSTGRVANAQFQQTFISYATGSRRTDSFEAERSDAYLKLSRLISTPPSLQAGDLRSTNMHPAQSLDTPFGYDLEEAPGVRGTPRRTVLPRPSNRHPNYSRDFDELPLINSASLEDMHSWCTLQFASDQRSRTDAYLVLQESLDDIWTQQQTAVNDSFKLLEGQFKELIQELEKRKSRVWQRITQTDALSRESIDMVFLRTATNAVDEAVRGVREAMDGYCVDTQLAIRRAARENSDRYRRGPSAMSSPGFQIVVDSSAPRRRRRQSSLGPIVVSSSAAPRSSRNSVDFIPDQSAPYQEFGIRSLFAVPQLRDLPILGSESTEQDPVGLSWLMEQDYDSQFSSAQLERQQDGESRERCRQLVFDSKLEEWDEKFAMQLQTQRAEFSGRISLFKRERREYMRRLCQFLSRRIEEASRSADNIVDHRLRECRTVVVEVIARLEKAGLEALRFATSPDYPGSEEVANYTDEDYY